MTEQQPTPTPPVAPPAAPPAAAYPAYPANPGHEGAMATTPAGHVPAAGLGPHGQIRSTGVCILLAIVTFGIYSLVWYFKTHEEMKRHSGTGLGGGVALLLAFFVGIAMPFLTSSEVGGLYSRRGQEAPVSGTTGLWYFPGIFILVGPIVWFVKTNGALNAYWRSVGATD